MSELPRKKKLCYVYQTVKTVSAVYDMTNQKLRVLLLVCLLAKYSLLPPLPILISSKCQLDRLAKYNPTASVCFTNQVYLDSQLL